MGCNNGELPLNTA